MSNINITSTSVGLSTTVTHSDIAYTSWILPFITIWYFIGILYIYRQLIFNISYVNCFYATIRKRCTSLMRRVRDSSNAILRVFVDRPDCQYLNRCRMIHMLANIQKK